MERYSSLVVGFILGGFARYYLAGWIYERLGVSFPYGTFVVNLTGCFLIGLFDSLAEVRFLIGPSGRLLLMTGFCGAYTTFSTLLLETSHLVADGEFARALINFLGSGLLGFLLVRLGGYIGTII